MSSRCSCWVSQGEGYVSGAIRTTWDASASRMSRWRESLEDHDWRE